MFGLVSKSVVRITKFALIKKLENFFTFFLIFGLEVHARACKVVSGSLKKLRKITIGNVKKCKILKNFLLQPVEISFFNRVYLRNGASWTPQTLDGQDSNFRSSMQIR